MILPDWKPSAYSPTRLKAFRLESYKTDKNGETQDLPDTASRLGDTDKINYNVVPEVLTNEGKDGETDDEGQNGGNRFSVDFTLMGRRGVGEPF